MIIIITEKNHLMPTFKFLSSIHFLSRLSPKVPMGKWTKTRDIHGTMLYLSLDIVWTIVLSTRSSGRGQFFSLRHHTRWICFWSNFLPKVAGPTRQMVVNSHFLSLRLVDTKGCRNKYVSVVKEKNHLPRKRACVLCATCRRKIHESS